ncbi:hypothetical protein [Thalassobius sp. Cn5-15]|uniref:phage adaptor protein n=1 Tax=Thalassobius sp. Cn5-15 TaxID=2917763 RepID=UPI001EF388F8|nr:hypothetical protein [Thalassobius sp. Cn5-15]MCG7492468.1 hypothetical protein [Thalassobius sp. Cn5-15]
MPFSRSILEIVNEASASASVSALPAIFGTAAIAAPTDETTRRLKGVIHDAAQFLNRETVWQSQWRTAQFTVPAGDESVPFPPDMDRIRSNTFYTQSHQYDRVHGNATAEEWRYLKSGNYSPFVDRFRIGADRIFIYPTPSDQMVFDFEYVSGFPWVDINGYFRGFCTSDDFRSVFDDFVLKLELKWRILREFGEPYAEEKQEADEEFAKRKSQEAAAPSIRFGSRDSSGLAGYYESNTVVLG